MYTLDTKAAQAADVVGSGANRITKSGEYVGKIKAAWEETANSGSKMIKINFVANDGDYINGLSFCVVGRNGTSLDKNGNYIPGFRVLNAILTCTEVKRVTESYGDVEVYDFDKGEVVTKKAKLLTELTGKDIGFLLQQEEYKDRDGYLRTNDDGTSKIKIEINTVFEASTGRTSTEKLKRVAKPEQKNKRLAYLLANPIRKVKDAKVSSGGIAPLPEYQNQQQTGAPQFGDPGYSNHPEADGGFDDSIPF